MRVDVSNFLISLAVAIGQTAPGLVFAQDLWVHQSLQQDERPTAVLRPYGGPSPEEQRPLDGLSVQVAARAKDPGDALALARKIFEALQDEDGIAQANWTIPAKKIGPNGAVIDDPDVSEGWLIYSIVFLQPPALAGRDPATGRNLVTFNLDVKFSN